MIIPTIRYLQQHPLPLNEWLSWFATDTWERIRFCRANVHNRVFETTITQNFVYQFLLLQRNSGVPVKIYEAKDEKANGNDLEIFLRIQGGYMKFPCQCKLIGRDGRYGFYYQSGNRPQIDVLLDYARQVRGVPIYLLYNFSSEEELNQRIVTEYEQRHIEVFGCSVTFAGLIYERYFPKGSTNAVPDFGDLHLSGRGWPLYFLPSLTGPRAIAKYAKYYSSHLHFTGTSAVIESLLHQTIDNERWIDLSPKASIGRIDPEHAGRFFSSTIMDTPDRFNPAYRLVIG